MSIAKDLTKIIILTMRVLYALLIDTWTLQINYLREQNNKFMMKTLINHVLRSKVVVAVMLHVGVIMENTI